jgi:hypothetical protein
MVVRSEQSIQTGQSQRGQSPQTGQSLASRYDHMIAQLESQKQAIERLLREEDDRLQERKA